MNMHEGHCWLVMIVLLFVHLSYFIWNMVSHEVSISVGDYIMPLWLTTGFAIDKSLHLS